MTLQEILQAVDELSVDEQTSLVQAIQLKLSATTQPYQSNENRGEQFWQGILRFRETIEREGIEFTDEDFVNLRDRSPGREIEL